MAGTRPSVLTRYSANPPPEYGQPSSSSVPNVAPVLSGLHSLCLDSDRCNQPEQAERRGNNGGPILPPRQTLCAVAEMPIRDPKNLSADGPAITNEHGDEPCHD